jgi:hypothetical protein
MSNSTGGKTLRRILTKCMPWLVFGCSLTLLLLANSATYRTDIFFDCRGLPLTYEGSTSLISILGGPEDFFRPLALVADIVVAIVVSGLIGLFVSRFGSMRLGPMGMFLLAISLFAAANVVFFYYEQWTPGDSIYGSNRWHNNIAP